MIKQEFYGLGVQMKTASPVIYHVNARVVPPVFCDIL